VRLVPSERANFGQEGGSLILGLDALPLEIFAQSYVGVQARWVFVKVQEGLRLAVKDAPLRLDEAID
jgi:hypothetical protein